MKRKKRLVAGRFTGEQLKAKEIWISDSRMASIPGTVLISLSLRQSLLSGSCGRRVRELVYLYMELHAT